MREQSLVFSMTLDNGNQAPLLIIDTIGTTTWSPLVAPKDRAKILQGVMNSIVNIENASVMLQERERCAKVAEQLGRLDVAKLIRSQ